MRLVVLAVAVLLAAAVWGVLSEGSVRESSPRLKRAAVVRAPSDAGAQAPPASENTFNPGWVGSPCGHDADCEYEGGFCLLPEEGFPRGYCSRACDRLCPDRKGDLYSTTFCVEDPQHSGRGLCSAGCNLHLTATGCRADYVCSSARRFGQDVVRMVCFPDRGTPPPSTPCTEALAELGARAARPDLMDAPSRPARPGDPMPVEKDCQLDTPVLLASPIRGVDFRPRGKKHAEHVLVACEMALALVMLAEHLAEMDVVEVEHYGTYNCRGVAGTSSLSGHGRGLAIDISGFERASGPPVTVLGDQRFVPEVLKRVRASGLFDVVLGPGSDRAHADHLHLELKPKR